MAREQRGWWGGAVWTVGRSALALLAWAAGATAAGADPSQADARTLRLQREALASDAAWELVAALTTEIGPRFSGTPADAAAIAWSEAKAKALGFPKVWSEPVTVPDWDRGATYGEIVAPWPQRVELLALGGSVATPAGGIEAEVLGVESLDALSALPEGAAAGKIVFLHPRMRRTESGAGYGETVPIRGRGAIEAAKKGAVAVLIRSVGTDSNRLPHTGAMRYDEAVPKIPAAALSVPDAELLERQLTSGKAVRFRLELGTSHLGETTSANVLAEFPGREKPEEIVLLVAHRDSWDVGTGAQDNATGVALVLEAARAVASGGAPRRTIRVLLTANEEFGLSGARAYAAAHAAELPRHALAVEMDSGAGRVLRLMTRFLPAEQPAAAELAALLAPIGIPYAEEAASGGADLIPLQPAGLPLVDLDQDRTLYFDLHHTENDTLDKIDRADLRQVQAALVTVVDWAANRPERLSAVPVETPAP